MALQIETMRTIRSAVLGIIVLAGLLVVTPAQAAPILSFDLDWSGASFGNGATATGTLNIDAALLSNPGFSLDSPFSDFSITVSGATVGNGTFTSSGGDFASIFLDIPGAIALDLTMELIGQATTFGPWGPTGGNGDFNFFSFGNPLAPTGVAPFTIETAAGLGGGDLLVLTSFRPAVPTPEPASISLWGLGAVVITIGARRKKSRNRLD
ncbi:MAG: hypothetical protein HZA46_24845 [Planctomycetales bacterium]|nr:hypothetical protein [Planctomycetales bacterium]